MAVICLGMTATSCDDEEEVSNSNIAGLWETTHSSGWEEINSEREEWDEPLGESDRTMLQLDADGTMRMWSKNYPDDAEEGRYSLDGNYLTMDYGEEDVYYVRSLDSNSMQLEYTEDGYYELVTFEKR